MSDEMLNDTFRRMGYAKEEFAGFRKMMDDNINKPMGEANSIRGVLMSHLREESSNPSTDVLIYLPDSCSPLPICIWSGGTESGICSISLIVPPRRRSTRQTALTRNVMFVSGLLVSWEVAMGPS